MNSNNEFYKLVDSSNSFEEFWTKLKSPNKDPEFKKMQEKFYNTLKTTGSFLKNASANVDPTNKPDMSPEQRQRLKDLVKSPEMDKIVNDLFGKND